eukprot:CAMPEP_0116055918 /NCGR_PEP_ID=MMETSP0322-20121206/3701_1 /TAXON_ID=163516 /ORGANISM="Leptocylindrus danicus var. apora, Strain B651" /LENGTH=235 /DNA_ID=CAMNT_0003539629 /DNA_START=172 /DNA_END=879 /DNA_ORIENTATION=+
MSMNRSTRPITTGTSVIGLKYKDGVMLAADTLLSYGSMAKFKDMRRLVSIGDDDSSYLVGAGGEMSDFQYIIQMLEQDALDDKMSGECTECAAKAVWSYLRAVMYHRRNKMNPLWNDVLVGGYDKDDSKAFLGVVDKIGTAYEDDFVATGFGAYLAMPILREKWRADLEEGEARAILEDCLRVLFYRDCRASNRVQIAKATADGTLVSEPYEIETSWDAASFVSRKGGLDMDGGW